MKTRIRNGAAVLALAAVAVAVSGCASDVMSRSERLSLYQSFAGAPVKQIPYFSPMGWEEIDSDHILLQMRPNASYLVRVSGPCLDYDAGSPVMFVTNSAGWVHEKFDHVSIGPSGIRCRIEEIQPIDLQGLRAARDG